MPEFIFWYKRKVIAKSLAEAIKKEPKAKMEFDEVKQDDKCDRDLTPCIGFTEYQEEDFE